MNKWKSFYHVLNYGRSDIDLLDASKIIHDRMNRSEVRMDQSDIIPTSLRQTYDIGDFSRITVTETEYPSAAQSTGLKTIEKILNRKLESSVKRWQNNTMIETKLERIHQEVEDSSPDATREIAKYGAVDALARLSNHLISKEKQAALQMIKLFWLKQNLG